MDDTMLDRLFENLDRRLATIEQILPTLVTNEELQAAISPLATKEELHREVREEGERSRRFMAVLIEHQNGKLDLLAEHVLSLLPKQPGE